MKNKLLCLAILMIFTSSSCKSQFDVQNNIELKKHILEKELNHLNNIGRDIVYIEYGLNNLIKEFIEKNTLSGEEDLEFHDYRKCMDIEEQRIIFNEKEVDNLFNQLNTSNDKIIYLIDLPENNTFGYAPIKEVKNNFKNGVPLSTSIYSYTLSDPIITLNRKYAILAYSKGYTNSQTGGIKIYKRINGNYKTVCQLESWTE